MYLIVYLNDLVITLLLKYTFSGFNKNGMKIERRLGTRLIVNLVLLAYWFPALIADTVIQCQKVDGVYIFTDYSTNWCSVLILVHLITATAITAMDLKYNGITETLIPSCTDTKKSNPHDNYRFNFGYIELVYFQRVKMDFTVYSRAFDQFHRYADFSTVLKLSFSKTRFLARRVTIILRFSGWVSPDR